MKELLVNENEKGQRFNKYLQRYLDKAPMSFIYKMLRKKNITLNNKKATGNELINSKDIVNIYLSDETFSKFSSYSKPLAKPLIAKQSKPSNELNIVYEDANILLLNKPINMLSQKVDSSDISINDLALKYLTYDSTYKPSICNRLDRNTSGLIIVGKTYFALRQITDLIKTRKIEKKYLCLVEGHIDVNEFKLLEAYISKDKLKNKVTIHKQPVADSEQIKTAYTCIISNNNYSLLEIDLITGKSHQIRAHLASINHPIIGDFKYNKNTEYFKKKYNLSHQLLHSYSLKFPMMTNELAYLSNKCFFARPDVQFLNIVKSELDYSI